MSKVCFIFLTVILTMNSLMAASVQLNAGDMVTIQPNVATTVTCNGGGEGVACASKVEAFRARFKTCVGDQNSTWCTNNIWPSFKQNNRLCLEEGMAVCMEFCVKDQSVAWCTQMCQ